LATVSFPFALPRGMLVIVALVVGWIPRLGAIASWFAPTRFAILVAVGGVYTAFRMYGKDNQAESDAWIASKFGPVYQVWKEKYNLDELYEGAVVFPTVNFSEKRLAVFDMKVVDGIVNAVAGFVRLCGSLLRYIQTGVASNYALFLILGVILVLAILLL
ncbi:MAG: hypothetical protein R3220_09810, partial [Balneolaceae bacterium]|nr:hypothetical protein [Balneolaceae bacterium]